MPITVKHTKVSTIPDDGDTSLVRPSDWNADHTLVGLGTMAEQNANNVAITGGTITGVSGLGDVTGPASATDNAVARYDATTGKLIQNSLVIIGDTGSVTGVNALTAESLTVNNDSTLGFSNADTLDVRARIISDLEPNANNAKDIGTSGRNWRDGFFGRTLHTVNLDLTGVATFSAGTVSAPAITTTGDTNTGIFFPAADTIAFTEGGVESMRITSAGNVGIGTSSPAFKLHVDGEGLIGGDSNNGIRFVKSGSINYIQAANAGAASDLHFGNWYGNGFMVLSSGGNVGIGVTSPTAKLEVYDATTSEFRVASFTNGFQIYTNSDGTTLGTYTNAPLVMRTNSAERMRITSAGGVSFGSSGTAYGTTGQVLTSQGDATPTWTDVVTPTGTQTLTNKRINPRAVAAGSTSGNLTPNGDTTDVFNAFGLTGAITLLTPSGTPVDGQRLMLRFEDNGTGRAITWTTSSGAFRAVGVTLPTTTVASKVTYVGCVYNSTDVFWDVIAVATQA